MKYKVTVPNSETNTIIASFETNIVDVVDTVRTMSKMETLSFCDKNGNVVFLHNKDNYIFYFTNLE